MKSVNYHLWQACNMRCKFCFATFQDVKDTVLPKGHLPKEDSLKVVEKLSEKFEKITFAGGEPTLCPWLYELVSKAKSNGMTTMVVSNGSMIDRNWFEQYKDVLDWLVISMDSANEESNLSSGRYFRKKALTKAQYIDIANLAHEYGIRFKVNTVVHSGNWDEDMSETIIAMKPERWKVLQVLAVDGQNSGKVDDLLIHNDKFVFFNFNNKKVTENSIAVVPETNDDILGSYLMVDPAGRFFDDSKHKHTYSEPILEVGVNKAINQITFIEEKYVERGAIYSW